MNSPNKEQVSLIQRGVEVWNSWRKNNWNVPIDLKNADLVGVKLQKINLSGVDLRFTKFQDRHSKVNLNGANLSGANFNGANLDGADFSRTDLRYADFTYGKFMQAKFCEADLSHTNLIGANFRDADLTNANLTAANLSFLDDFAGVDISRAIFGQTILGRVDLSLVKGLRDAVHDGWSYLSSRTILLSKGKIPEEFLRGCGLGDFEIESTRLYDPELSNDEINKILYKIYDLRAQQPLQITPLFISYSHTDSKFVDKLEVLLNKKGIRFWRDIHSATSGRLEKQIDRAIRQNPTVLLVLSENSIKSDWVQHEVRRARELEKEIGHDVLCPVSLDDSWKTSPWPQRIMEQVVEYNILDFSKWDDDNNFGNIFEKLVDGLNLYYKKS